MFIPSLAPTVPFPISAPALCRVILRGSGPGHSPEVVSVVVDDDKELSVLMASFSTSLPQRPLLQHASL